MNEDLNTYLEEMGMIVSEIEEYDILKKKFLKELKTLSLRYEKGEINYKNYAHLKEKILSGKTKEENIEYFNSYILSLLKKLEYLNTQIFSTIYSDESIKKAILKIEQNKNNAFAKKTQIKEEIAKPIIIEKQEIPLAKAKTEINATQVQQAIKEVPRKIAETKKEEIPKPVTIIPKEIAKEKVVQVQQIKKTTQETTPQKTVEIKETKKVIPENKPVKKEEQTAKIQNVTVQELKPETINPNREVNKKLETKEINEINDTKLENIAEEKIEVIETKQESIENVQTGAVESVQDENNFENGGYDIPKPKQKSKINIPSPKKKDAKGILKSLFSEEKPEKNEIEKNIGSKSVLSFEFLKDFARRIRQKENIISKVDFKEKSILDFSDLKNVNFEKESTKNPNLLVKQAAQLKELLNKRKIKIYNPSVIGTISNVTVRKISISLIETFPDFFKNFYLTLRYANIKILSNTYINIMVFLSIITSMIFGTITGMVSIFSGNPLMLVISKVFLMSLLGMTLCAGFMIYYPNMLIKKRTASINTNLPFAIDHMSSIVASGVPPAAMFRLLSESKEYGDVSLEIEKISNYIDIFGYDLLTAIKSIAITTPSPQFKEFLDGLVSTIETGGSLKNYLSQKSQEAILSYKIERQKYVEIIGTYSDIYTGVLIAAPLFFVSALSLVSILGGKIGGYNVETIISFGTYLVIPLLNIAFIVFLEANQPEV